MNQTINQMLNHTSIRKYKDQPVTEEQVNTIVKCAQMASTSTHDVSIGKATATSIKVLIILFITYLIY